MIVTVIQCAEPSGVGRVELYALPQQTLLELLVENVLPKEIFTDAEHHFTDFAQWQGVALNDGHIDVIDWSCGGLSGSMDFRMIPRSVSEVVLTANRIQCTLDTTCFPTILTHFCMSNNVLFGRLDLTGLPEGMLELSLGSNKLSGSLELTSLPRSLQYLQLMENLFSGTINLTHLPQSLVRLDLGANELIGSVDLTTLPEELQQLHLYNNCLEDVINLSKLPSTLRRLNLQGNLFSGRVEVSDAVEAISFLAKNPNLEIVRI